MAQTREELTQNLAERLCWQVARRDDLGLGRLFCSRSQPTKRYDQRQRQHRASHLGPDRTDSGE